MMPMQKRRDLLGSRSRRTDRSENNRTLRDLHAQVHGHFSGSLGLPSTPW